MRKAAGKLLALCLSLVMFAGGISLEAFAQETVFPKVFHTYKTTEDLAIDEWTSALRGAYLGNGLSVIARADKTHVHIGGETEATKVCDEVYLTLYLERSKSYATGYSTYKYYDYEVKNDYAIFKEISNIPVDRGYYYRVKGVHMVYHNGVLETTDSVTDPIDYR